MTRVKMFQRENRFDELIGGVEDDRFEAKSQTYQLEKDRGKLELAKDVAGLANEPGGIEE